MTLRTDRVSSLLKEEIGAFFSREFRDSSTGLITVTDVHMSPDLKLAKIYVSVFGTSEVKQKTMEALEERKSEIRSFLGSHVRMKFTPSIAFYLDETLDRVEHIEQLLRKIHQDEPKASGGTGESES
jgi:ribosome-binding factor A